VPAWPAVPRRSRRRPPGNSGQYATTDAVRGLVPFRLMGRRWEALKGSRLWHPKGWGVVKTYSSFKPLTRILIVLSLIAGCIMLVICSSIDLGGSKWWHSHAYIPNIWAGFTGFLIGAPVALVVLATFTVEREENTALERVNRLSRLAWYTFRDTVYAFCTEERIDALQKRAPDVEKAHDEAFKAVQDYVAYIRRPVDQSPEALGARINAIKVAADPFATLANGVMIRVKDSGTIETEWAAVVGAWNTLDQYVRLQRLERDLAWFDPQLDAGIRKWMSRTKNPLQEFTDVHGFAPERKHSADTMVDAANATRWYASYSEDELLKLLRHSSSVFGYSQVRDYNARTRAASYFLSGLLGTVNAVEFANWPESASKPVDATNRAFEKSGLRWVGSTRTPEGMAAAVAEFERWLAEKRSGEPAQSSESESSSRLGGLET
jgi:hypothetical protein